MKANKLLALLLAAVIVIMPLAVFAQPDNIVMDSDVGAVPEIKNAQAALLMDMDSGRILYSKNAQSRMFPASTTKMMTAILAIENGNFSDMVTATYDALKDITLEDSHMGILIGEEMLLEELINGMMIYSANDAANVIAIHLAGSIEAFSNQMNAKAAELGMNNTHFVNACGMHDDNHYTTAEDLAILARYCMQNEKFREIVKKPQYTISATNKFSQARQLPNTNLFLRETGFHYYESCMGIKTGYTSSAGNCLVSAAERNGVRLLAVVLKCENTDAQAGAYSYVDSRSLLDFGFNNYDVRSVVQPGTVVTEADVQDAKGKVSLTVTDEIKALMPVNADTDTAIVKNVELASQIYAPVNKGDVLGRVTYTYDGKLLGTAQLVAANDVEISGVSHVFRKGIALITNPYFFIPVFIRLLIAI